MLNARRWTTTAAALVMLSGGPAWAQITAQDAGQVGDGLTTDAGWKTYDGYAAVRTWPATAREQLAVSALDMTMLDEARRVAGGTTWAASPDQMTALEAAGVRFDVLDADLGRSVRAERTRLKADRAAWQQLADLGVAARVSDDVFFTEFRPLTDPVAPDLQEFLGQLLADFPALLSVQEIGRSQAENRPIDAYTISTGPAADGGPKPAVFFTGMCHAREWISPMTVLYMMRGMLDGYGTDSSITRVLDEIDIHVVPVSNPDGYAFSWESQRFWRKTRRDNGDGNFGVDWNRNFSEGFGLGSSGNTNSDTYRGTAPFSEPETQTIRDFMLSRPEILAHVDVHSYSQLILYPLGYTFDPAPEPQRTAMATLAETMSDTIASVSGEFYNPIQASGLYIAGGTSMDWTFGGAGVLSWTYELRPSSQFEGGFAPPPDQILPTAIETFEAFQDLFEAAASGVVGRVLGGPPVTVNEAQPTPVSIELAPAFNGGITPASATLYTRTDGGAFAGSPMDASGLTFTASLPGGACGETIEWYAEVADTTGAVYAVPFAGDAEPFAAEVVGVEFALFDDAETDIGWIVGSTTDDATTGMWERGDPEGTLAQPEDDHTPTGTDAWVTGLASLGSLGGNDVDDGRTTLTSPMLDATPPPGRSAEDAYLVFHYWFSNDTGGNPGSDALVVRLANDNGVLFTITNTIIESSGAWLKETIRIADYMEPTDQMRIQFIAIDQQGGSIVEAAIDDVSIEFRGCVDPDVSPADLAAPFGVLDLADIDAFIAGFQAADPVADLAPPVGVYDLSDVDAFIAAFLGG
ncbi:MAG: M14 family zinc carboxypeptidase [Planctomycetota bacterium]